MRERKEIRLNVKDLFGFELNGVGLHFGSQLLSLSLSLSFSRNGNGGEGEETPSVSLSSPVVSSDFSALPHLHTLVSSFIFLSLPVLPTFCPEAFNSCFGTEPAGIVISVLDFSALLICFLIHFACK